MIEKFGIYQIRNKLDNKSYIGSTVNLNKRLRCHLSQLLENKHHNIYLQRAWDKYGKYNFIFDILEIVNKKKDLIKREQYWLDYYESYSKIKGYNIRKKAVINLAIASLVCFFP